MSVDAMKQALEALETIADEVFSPYDNQLGNAILALRLAIEQAERLEKGPAKIFGPNLEQILNSAGFYKRQPLTDSTLWEMWVESPSDVLRFARAIERKHGIGGEA
jgi:hypothetical protein